MQFLELIARAQGCAACPAMAGRRRVLSGANGSPLAPLMFIAEAPGRLGAERTGVPFSGDQAGRSFELLLREARLTRTEVFVTNAVLCNPQDAAGRNRPPARAELARCSRWLIAQLEVVQPAIVVALGQAALRALALVEHHEVVLARDVGRLLPWAGRQLYALYHPAFRARRFRAWERQVEDWRRLGAIYRGRR